MKLVSVTFSGSPSIFAIMYRPVLALAGFVAVALAASGPNPFNVPEGFSLTAGKPTTLKWDPTTPGTVTLRLREGASNDLNEGSVIQGKN